MSTETPELKIGIGRCHGPDCQQPAVRIGGFCSETCYWKWHRRLVYGDTTPAVYVLEWRHPYLGDVHETACRRHFDLAREALRTLGVGHSGAWAAGEPCVRCVHEGKEPRDWVAECVTLDLRAGDL